MGMRPWAPGGSQTGRGARETCPGKIGQSHRQEREDKESNQGHLGALRGPEVTFPISRIGCPPSARGESPQAGRPLWRGTLRDQLLISCVYSLVDRIRREAEMRSHDCPKSPPVKVRLFSRAELSTKLTSASRTRFSEAAASWGDPSMGSCVKRGPC